MTISISETLEIKQTKDREVVLSVEGVSKKFCRSLKHSLFYGIQDIATDLVGSRNCDRDLRNKEFWALDNVSFELKKGEAIGLVGKNGSGKSTLLRIIAGLIKPDQGRVKVKGRVAPLIALGAGFNPILTGRENIYANMSILGLSKKEIDERFDEVVEFAEIGDAIDAPVQTYSSGMAARLGFASAIYTEPDILLIDEVLAVGDIKFRAKCNRRLIELRQKDTSFILVSHQTQSLLNVCDSAIYLLKGKFMAAGDTTSIISQYEQDLFATTENIISAMFLDKKAQTNDLGLDIISLYFKDNQDNILDAPITGGLVYFCVKCQVDRQIEDVGLTIDITELNQAGENSLVLSSFNDRANLRILPGESEIRLCMPYLCLKPGIYSMKVYIRQKTLYTLDFVESFVFKVISKSSIGRSSFYQPRTWKIIDSKTI
jgi:lipopolysaccharide transport system ATP-binding protein